MRPFPWLFAAIAAAILGMGLAFVASASATVLPPAGGPEAAAPGLGDPILSTAERPYFKRQALFAAIGLAAFFLISRVRPGTLYDLSYFFYGASLVLLVAVFAIGHRTRDVARWIPLPFGFNLQPSELAKIALALALARVVSDLGRVDRLSRWWWPALLAALPAALVLAQPDLGTTLLLLPLPSVILFVAGARIRHFILVAIFACVFAVAAWESGVVRPYQKERLVSFLDPGRDPAGAGYQAQMSVLAIGAGGTTGQGWRSGTMNLLQYVPERHTDFIFSVVGEEGGFAGSVLLLALYFALLAVMLLLAILTPEPFARLSIVGLSLPIGLQVLINVAMTLRLAPVTGITLPLASYGGSSLVVTFLTLGLVAAAYRRGHLPHTPSPKG